jgi:hypothetical protein
MLFPAVNVFCFAFNCVVNCVVVAYPDIFGILLSITFCKLFISLMLCL